MSHRLRPILFFVLLLHWAPSTWISLRSDLATHTAHSHSRSLNTAIALFRALGCYLLHILLYYCAVQCYVLLYTGYILGYSGLGRRVEKRWRGGFMLPPCAAGVRKVPWARRVVRDLRTRKLLLRADYDLDHERMLSGYELFRCL